MNPNRAFITELPGSGNGIRVGVKDNIDVRGVVSTLGSAYVAEHRSHAQEDASCLRGLRRAGANIVAKTNLHELAFGTTGVNRSFGTPINPIDAECVPGGSSSGSAVAVAIGACDVALGTDTGGSVRIPPACCGVAGLKTTYGRISTEGVWPLAKSLDVIGPIARDTEGLVRGMYLLDQGFEATSECSPTVARLAVAADDFRIDAAVDEALRRAGFRQLECSLTQQDWERAIEAVDDIIAAEAAQANESWSAVWGEMDSGPGLERGAVVAADHQRMDRAYKQQGLWRNRLSEVVAAAGMLALPTLAMFPPTLEEVETRGGRLARFTSPVSLAGLPSVVVPVPSEGRFPASLQLVGLPNSEGQILAAARLVETAVR